MEFRKKKRCPRCNYKMDRNQIVCPNCELNFNKFNQATNRGAKQAYHRGDGEQVLLRTGCPSDVKKWVLLLLTIFFGFCGVHQFYVGRKRLGLTFLFFFGVGVINAFALAFSRSIVSTEVYQVFSILVFIWGIFLAWWLLDIIRVITNQFKIPVSPELDD